MTSTPDDEIQSSAAFDTRTSRSRSGAAGAGAQKPSPNSFSSLLYVAVGWILRGPVGFL